MRLFIICKSSCEAFNVIFQLSEMIIMRVSNDHNILDISYTAILNVDFLAAETISYDLFDNFLAFNTLEII